MFPNNILLSAWKKTQHNNVKWTWNFVEETPRLSKLYERASTWAVSSFIGLPLICVRVLGGSGSSYEGKLDTTAAGVVVFYNCINGSWILFGKLLNFLLKYSNQN